MQWSGSIQDKSVIELEGMPQFDMAMQRLYAWYENEIIDRPPVRFMAHNAFLEAQTDAMYAMSPEEKKACWFNVEQQVENYARSIDGRRFHAETFPVFFPNLGPDIYSAFYGAELEFGEVTSWSIPIVENWEDADQLVLNMDNQYFKKIEELTSYALEVCNGRFLVGYTDLHPGLDCVAAWRDPQQLCFDMIDHSGQVKRLADKAIDDFETIYNHFDDLLKSAGQLSVGWMGIPSYGRMHIPSCDFSTLISPEFFREFGLPILQREVKTMTHNVFHVDGKGVAKHLDTILSVPQVHAVQWVQGMGDYYPILQWIPFLKELQAKNVPVIVDMHAQDLDEFMAQMNPKGLFLWIATINETEELEIMKRIDKWR